jgi:hypothetical protein
MKTILFILLLTVFINATVLGDSAASMVPGTWKRMDPAIPNALYNQYGSIFVYSNDAIWDPATEKLMFWGRDHGDPWQGVIYEAATDTWKSAPLAFAPMHGGHTYDNLTLDSDQNVIYHFTSGKELFKFDPASETWSTVTQNGTIPRTGHGMALEYFPEMGGLIHCYSGGFGFISFFDLSTSTWRQLASGLTMGPYHNLAEYNPVHHCVIAGGGNGSNDLYKVDSQGNITALTPAPMGIGIHQGNLTCDRVSGTFLVQRNDSIYGFDVQYDYWFNLGPVPAIDNVHSVVAPVPEYGVVAFLYRNMWLYKYAGPFDTIPVTQVTLQAEETQIEQYLWTHLSVITNYQGGGRDTATNKCKYTSLEPSILSVDINGKVIALATGQGRIEVFKRGAADTVTITVVASTAGLDSLQVSVPELGLLATESYTLDVTGYFHKDDKAFFRNLNTEVTWTSDDEGIATVINGNITGISAGGPLAVVAQMDGITDTTLLTVWSKPAFITRINFQVKDEPFSFGWLADNGIAYTPAAGMGWVNGSGLMTRDDRTGSTNFLLKSFVGGSTRQNYKIDVPDGDYIIKYGLGDNQYGSTDSLWYENTLLAVHAGASNLIQVDTVTATGTNGITLTVNGKINYLVVISEEGIDINQVADDGGIPVPPISAVESAGIVMEAGIEAYPNPFNPVIQIKVMRDERCEMRAALQIYNVSGKQVAKLTHHTSRITHHVYTWNASRLPSGIYIARIRLGNKVFSKRLILSK